MPDKQPKELSRREQRAFERERRRALREKKVAADLKRRQLIKVGVILGGTGLFGAVGAGGILLARRTPQPVPGQESFRERFIALERSTNNNDQEFYRRSDELRALGVEAFVSGMQQLYGISFDSAILASQVKILRDAEFRAAIINESGCLNFNPPAIINGLTNPGWDFAYLNVDSAFKHSLGRITPAYEAVSGIVHELGHHTPELNTDQNIVSQFQRAIIRSGWRLTGIKGFGLVIEAPLLNKEGKACIGRPGDDLTILEEAMVEYDKVTFMKRVGINSLPVSPFQIRVSRFQEMLIDRLTPQDKVNVGGLHQKSDLIGFLVFYRQNFGAQGGFTDLFLGLNKTLS